MTTIVTKNGSGAPTSGDLVQGELAVDLTNKRLYTEDSGGSVIEVGSNPTTLTTGTFTSTGTATISTADINGGAIDGTIIGGNTPAAATVTTFTSTGIDDNATSTAITIDSSENVGIGTASPSSLLEVSASDAVNVPKFQISQGIDGLESTIVIGNNMRWDGAAWVKQASSLGGAAIELVSPNSAGKYGEIVFSAIDDTNTASGTAAERMRIDSSGNLLSGKTTTSINTNGLEWSYGGSRLSVTGSGDAGDSTFQANITAYTSGTHYFYRCKNLNSTIGGVVTTDGTDVILQNLSDGRLKKNVETLDGELANIMALNPVSYNWIQNGAAGVGFIAQELAPVYPDLVSYIEDEDVYALKSVSAMDARLVKAIQEQQAMIEELKAEVAALKESN